jgi:hypothetical protein
MRASNLVEAFVMHDVFESRSGRLYHGRAIVPWYCSYELLQFLVFVE